MKQCAGKCKQVKDDSEFARATGTITGLQSWCRACQKEYNEEYKAKEKDEAFKTEENLANILRHILKWDDKYLIVDHSGILQAKNAIQAYELQTKLREKGIEAKILKQVVIKIGEE